MTEERQQKLLKVIDKRQFNITVVLENIEDPHNIAAVLRSCESVGMQEVYILNTQIPPHKKKLGKEIGFRSGSGAAKWLTIHEYNDTATCVHDLRKHFAKIYTTAFSHDAKDLYEMDFTGSMALVFGNEKYGITAEMLNLADGNFLIPQVGIIQSLNISVACAVTVYEAFRQKRIAAHYHKNNVSAAKKETLLQEWGVEEENQKTNGKYK